MRSVVSIIYYHLLKTIYMDFKDRHAKRHFFFYTNMASAKNILPEKVRKLRQTKVVTEQRKRPKIPK